MRFLIDEDLSPAVARICRGLGLDAVSVHEIERRGFVHVADFSVLDGLALLARKA